ncbi:MAG: hypothetical protein E3J90_08960 [Promethearchaeota archaeon]|nr:MAG: hypothetical protein E3J90_08960 [Candidatus Lokiarchaeota archaeon]
MTDHNFLLKLFNIEGNEEPLIPGIYSDKVWIENDRLYLRVIDKPNLKSLTKYFTKEHELGENCYSIECDLSGYSGISSLNLIVESRFSSNNFSWR